jgi:hypothetical protein|tara:strand:- start:855 stop:1241 length:387 start_codon:yes stop_codon:yes gene_type:complete
MAEFNLSTWFKKSYLSEAKIEESFEYNNLAKSHTSELEKISDNNPSVSMGDYGDREDSDPLKGKGWGSLSFIVRGELSDNEWSEALDWVKSKGYKITSDTNWYERDIDDDRAWYPKIKFEFNTEDIKL